jgi:hypothetical protein
MDLLLTAACRAAAAALISLRLTGEVRWPWRWITAPLWAPIGISVASFANGSGRSSLAKVKPPAAGRSGRPPQRRWGLRSRKSIIR